MLGFESGGADILGEDGGYEVNFKHAFAMQEQRQDIVRRLIDQHKKRTAKASEMAIRRKEIIEKKCSQISVEDSVQRLERLTIDPQYKNNTLVYLSNLPRNLFCKHSDGFYIPCQ